MRKMRKVFISVLIALAVLVAGICFSVLTSENLRMPGTEVLLMAILYLSMVHAVCAYLIIAKLNERKETKQQADKNEGQ